MSLIDLALILLYLVAVLVIAARASRSQRSDRDYNLAGGSLPWWASGMSVMATQTSAIRFITISAFVALTNVTRDSILTNQ